MSQSGIASDNASAIGFVNTLTGNSGGAVPPTAGNINVVGSGNITVTGTPGTSTLTITETSFVIANNYTLVTGPMTYVGDSGVNPDYYIAVNSSGGAVTLQFPNTTTSFRTFTVKDRNGNSSGGGTQIHITTVGGAVTIDGQTTATIDSNFGSLQLLFNGTSYEIY